LSAFSASSPEAFVSSSETKLDYNTLPEKDNSTDSTRGLTDGMKVVISGFEHYPFFNNLVYQII
jgi:hypothetical protein